jgi:polyphenol oxidase
MRMLERVVCRNGAITYVSPRLRGIGVAHAFSTRLGGVSGGAFSSLNLGNPNGCPVQDDWENIRENYRRLMEAAGLAGRPLRRAHQVHGAKVIWASAAEVPENDPKADAVLTDDPGCAVSVRTADCLPILLASADGKIVGAVHAGWRGIVAGVASAAVEAMRRRGCGRLLAAIGPGIGPQAFEIGPEVVEEFRRVFGQGAPIRPGGDGRGLLDAGGAVLMQLVRAGMDESDIDTTDRCTFRDADEFFSHRREHGVTGRMAAVIAPR